MSYRNPEIITDKSGEILAQGLASFGQSVAAGITKAGANAAQIKKDRAAETANLRKLQTDVELQTNERANAFKTNLPKTSLNAKLNPIIDARLKQAADAQIALYNESDPELRAQYLKTIQSVDNFLVTTGTFIGNIKDEAEAWNALNPSDIDKTVGISGKDKESIKNNQGLLNLFSGKSTGEFDLFFDDKTNSISLNAKGEMGGVPWAVNDFNSFNYLTSGGELTYDIPDLASKTVETARKLVTDKQGKLLPGVAKEQVTKRIYQDVVGKDNKKIGRVLMEGQIEELDSAKINSLINADIASSAKGFLAAPLTQQNAMYATQLDGDRASWSDFIKENSDPAAQEAELERLFKKVAIEGIGKDFKSYEKNGETIYYRSVTPLKEVKPEKPETASATDKKAAELEKTASNYYDQFIANPVDFLGTQANFSEALNYDGNIIQLNLSKPGEEPDFKAFDPTEPQGRQLLFDYWINNSSLNQTLRDKLKEINSKNKGNIIPKEDEYYGQ
jgi:hypothetical protein